MFSNWLVVQTKARNEDKACINLKRLGFEVFYTKIKKSNIFFNKIKFDLKPLFPGYIFVKLNVNGNWHKINNTYGVARVMKFGETTCFLPYKILQSLKRNCDQNDVFQQNFALKKGNKLKIRKLNLPPIDAIFEEVVDTKRSYVLMSLLNTKIKTLVNNDLIEAVV